MARNPVQFASRFFFDRDAVIERVDAAKRGRLSRAGAFVRRRARGLLKVARGKTLAEMSDEERQRFRIRQEYARRQGLSTNRKALKPKAASEPGEPPRVSSRQSPLRSLLFFAYDPSRDSVVVGPERLTTTNGKTGTELLEFGGRGDFGRVEPRPYMRPAMETEAAAGTFAELWRDSL